MAAYHPAYQLPPARHIRVVTVHCADHTPCTRGSCGTLCDQIRDSHPTLYTGDVVKIQNGPEVIRFVVDRRTNKIHLRRMEKGIHPRYVLIDGSSPITYMRWNAQYITGETLTHCTWRAAHNRQHVLCTNVRQNGQTFMFTAEFAGSTYAPIYSISPVGHLTPVWDDPRDELCPNLDWMITSRPPLIVDDAHEARVAIIRKHFELLMAAE